MNSLRVCALSCAGLRRQQFCKSTQAWPGSVGLPHSYLHNMPPDQLVVGFYLSLREIGLHVLVPACSVAGAGAVKCIADRKRCSWSMALVKMCECVYPGSPRLPCRETVFDGIICGLLSQRESVC